MQINYRIFKRWSELDNLPEAKEFMCYQIDNGLIIALNYQDMRRLFITRDKARVIEANANLISELQEALTTGQVAGVIEV